MLHVAPNTSETPIDTGLIEGATSKKTLHQTLHLTLHHKIAPVEFIDLYTEHTLL